MTACAMSLPAVPGLLAAESCREFWTGPPTPRSGSWSAGSRWPGSNGWRPRRPPVGRRAKALVGDLTADDLGLSDETIAELGSVDHVVHCAAIYDITVAEDAQRAANVEGTRAVIALARRLGATLHHVSSIAVAGTYRGEYTEDDFDVAQDLPTPYHQTKFEAELLVRSEPGLRYRDLPARGRGRRFAHRRDGQGRRSVLLLRPSWRSWPGCRRSPRSCCPTPDAPTSSRSTTSSTPLDRTDARRRPRRPDVPPHRTRQHRPARHLPRHRRGGGPAAAARFAAARRRDPVPAGDRAGQGAAQYGGDAAGHPRRDPRRRRPDADLHRRQHRRKRCGAPESRFRSSRRTRRSCGGTGPSTSTPTGRGATIRPARWSASTSSSPARPAVSAARRRSRSPNAARRSSRWPATPKRSTTWSPRSARPAARRTRSRATSPTRRRWSTPSRTSSAGSATSTIWSTTRAGRSADRSSPRPTGCTTTNA